MAEILPIWRKTLSNQSVNQSFVEERPRRDNVHRKLYTTRYCNINVPFILPSINNLMGTCTYSVNYLQDKGVSLVYASKCFWF